MSCPPGCRRPNGPNGRITHDPADNPGPGITQEGAPTRWKATGFVEGVGWLEAWGTSLPTALAALQALAGLL